MQNANEQGEILSPPPKRTKKWKLLQKNFLNAWRLRDILLFLHSENKPRPM